MTQEEKELLLKVLCTRQMYDVKCRVKYSFNNETTNGRDVWTEDDDTIKMVNPEYGEVLISYLSEWVDIENVKPYLRPMSSMTKNEKEEFTNLCFSVNDFCDDCDNLHPIDDMINWLNSHYFDYRGLIDKKLALEAPEEMYNKMEE